MFGKFWGDHIEGKLKEIMDSIWADNQDNTIKVLPVLEKEKYGSPQLLLNEKPSEDCLNKLNEHIISDYSEMMIVMMNISI